MKLSRAEIETLEDNLEIRRKARRHAISDKPLKCSVRRGDVVEANGRFLAVVGLPRLDGDEYVIRFEEVGDWALKAENHKPGPPMSELENQLPGVLSFTDKPDVEPGDLFVFETQRVDGKDYPKVYLRVSSNPVRGKKGEWRVNYVKVGFDRDRYPAKQTGYTENPHIAMDDLAAVPKDWQDMGAGERDLQRQLDRREVMKQEDEILKAATRLKQVGKQSSRKGRDLTHLLRDVYDRLAEEERAMREAA